MARKLDKALIDNLDNIFSDTFGVSAPGRAVATAAHDVRGGDVDFLLDLVGKLKGHGALPDDAPTDVGGGHDAPVVDLDLIDALARGGKAGGGGGGGGGKGKPDKIVSDPGTTDPGTTDPGTTDPGTTDPGTGPAPAPTPAPTPVYYQGADYVSGLDTPDGFNIEIVFSGSWSTELKAALTQAAEFLSDIITGDLADAVSGSTTIDDVRINASLSTMDGVGGKVGSGGMDAYRSGSYLTTVGHMSFDAADAASLLTKGLWDDVVSHEIMHALGFGLTWNALGLVTDVGGDLRFNGAKATKVYNADFAQAATDAHADIGVPIETDGGTGTAGKHWDEATFGNELMTGWLSNNAPMSNMTIAALEDMGYETVFDESAYFIV